MTERTLPAFPLPASEPSAADGATSPPEGESAGCASKPALPRLDPTRYGDWELHGKCVDF
jgi:hypothetical protein